ncbi:precorrin-6y C5,15-methyltransferase (decarboxylating) subunit CbiE [Anaerobacillus sp. MEB173]|uniref:precorrin-6y C5,15-methyltransferase (decarboxylating) subunit CbiE n=1 Tax=Anaerobacillus sp. MEB173 TaxID=3383345 RepID=UPI003F8F8656
MTKAIKVIGIGEQGKASLLPVYLNWIEECELLVGGERHLAFFPDFQGEKLPIKGGLSKVIERIQELGKETVVLASGDPLFFGIGSYLAKKMPVEIYPVLSSIQEAFARIQESWQDCTFISVHGRSMKGLAQKMDGNDKVCLLTDAINSPKEIARYLLSFGMNEYKAFVGEALGGSTEKTAWMKLEEMADYEADPLNVVILKRKEAGPTWTLGIHDHEFYQRKPDKGLLTKKEIRVLSLSLLQLTRTSTVWDIGTCTGSMAIEAARISRDGAVFAIEKNEADLENCLKNSKKFRTDITAIQGKAPERLEEFPDPDAIFIGGTGGNMKELLQVCCSRLKQDGRIVLNAVTIETLSEALQTFKELGFQTTVTQANIARSKPILHMNRFESLNPIYMICAHKGENTE